MKLNIVNESPERKASKEMLSKKELQTAIDKIRTNLLKYKVRNSILLKQKKELTVVFLGSAQMKRINHQFRKKNKPTDILSFSSDDPESLGELLVCTEVLKEQALHQGHSLKHESVYMLIHGVLHLLGYDHEFSPKEEKLMFKLQDRCYSDLGLVQNPKTGSKNNGILIKFRLK